MKKTIQKEHSEQKVARSEFSAAIAQVAAERKIDPEAIYDAIRSGLVLTYKRQFEDPEDADNFYYKSEIDPITAEFRIVAFPVLAIDEETGEILTWDEKKPQDVTPAGFGRIAAQMTKQAILQKIRESEKEQIISEYSDKIGEMVTGQVLRMERRDVLLDIGRGHGVMPPTEQMRGEFYKSNARLAVVIVDIADLGRGKQVIVSRTDKELVTKLLEREVPEVASGAVKIVYLAREAGVRTKLVVKAETQGVDPVGSCVGQRGVRVQEVIKELNNEKIDIIPYSDDMTTLIQSSLAPAENMMVEYDEKNHSAIVTIPDDQVSLAIGRGGQNVRVAAKLLNIKIEIKNVNGITAGSSTGQEEYEIDTYVGLEPETREALVQSKLTTMNDLMRFKNKVETLEEVTDDQKKLLLAMIAKAEIEEAEHEKSRAERMSAVVKESDSNKKSSDNKSEA